MDLISRQAAITLPVMPKEHREYQTFNLDDAYEQGWNDLQKCIESLPSAEPERTEYIPDTKAVRSKRDCVDLAERVDATFYDQEHEEWTQKTVTIADVLDSVCDEYTILPSAQPEYEPLTAEDFAKTMSENTIYSFMSWHGEALELMERQGFVICKKTI